MFRCIDSSVFLQRLLLILLLIVLIAKEEVVCDDITSGQDWIAESPLTHYEMRPIRPQNMDFDFENNMFLAHSAWLHDQEVHYYKFRMYTEEEYPGLISKASTSDDVPIQRVYVVTSNGTLSGALGRPIIDHHSVEGNVYSDFMELYLVQAPASYLEDFFRSEGDILSSGQPVNSTGIIFNMPIVPFGSKLQHPGQTTTTRRAPIDPVEVWYRGVDVWTYVFEVTDPAAATFFAFTRPTDDPDFAITVTSFVDMSMSRIRAAPVWFLNQYTNGVNPGVNSGGPSPNGMRNLLSLDRFQDGYSPLRSVEWVTEVPIDFGADDASNSSQLRMENGFAMVSVPMWINSPLVGSTATVDNPNKKESFFTFISTTKAENVVAGSPESSMLQRGVTVTLETEEGVSIGTADTNTMGAYTFQVLASTIPAGTSKVLVKNFGNTTRQVRVRNYLAEPPLTIYEQDKGTVENMGFDKENNLFLAQSTWYKDRETFLYQFHLYSIGTEVAGASSDVPLQKLFLITTNGWEGVVGRPILQYHHADGALYSDFMEVVFVTAPENYVEDSFRAVEDIQFSGASSLSSGILINSPLVPRGAGLQDPASKDTTRLPVQPLPVWYKGVEVCSHVLETTDALAADYFSWTRESPGDDGLNQITVASFGTLQNGMETTPLWFLNHFRRGVSIEKDNAGGPDQAGMRNIVNSDRSDQGYSPLRQINWVAEVPMDYLADEVSSSADVSQANGFAFVQSPIFINSPSRGLTRQEINPNRKVGPFQTVIDPTTPFTWILGSDSSLIFMGRISVIFQTWSGAILGEVNTTSLGAYEFQLNTFAIPPWLSSIYVSVNGTIVRTIGLIGTPSSSPSVERSLQPSLFPSLDPSAHPSTSSPQSPSLTQTSSPSTPSDSTATYRVAWLPFLSSLLYLLF